MAHLSQIHGDGLSIQQLARQHLTRLRDAVNETVHLGVMRGEAVVYIDKLESSNSIRLVSTVGQEMPMLTTALWRAWCSLLQAWLCSLLQQGVSRLPRPIQRSLR
jgi:DNA-binding IclR family transcriptional regulator